MDRFLIAIVLTVLFAFAGYYKAAHGEEKETNVVLTDSIQVLNCQIDSVTDFAGTMDLTNTTMINFMCEKDQEELKQDSTYLYLIDKQN